MNLKKFKHTARILILLLMISIFAHFNKGAAASGGNRVRHNEHLPGALPNYDIRDAIQVNVPQPITTSANLVAVSMTWNERQGVPKLLIHHGGYLTPPSNASASIIAKQFLSDNQQLFNLSNSDLDNLIVTKEYETKHNQAIHLVFSQQDAGREVHGSLLKVTVDRLGRIVIIGGSYFPGVSIATAPALSAEDAVRSAAENSGIPSVTNLNVISSGDAPSYQTIFENTIARGIINPSDITAELVSFPMPVGHENRLGWKVVAEIHSIGWYENVIDAVSGELLFRHNYYASDGPEGTVFTEQHPDASGNVRDVVSFDGAPFNDAGWVTDDTTAGNNVNAYQDLPNNNMVGYQPTTPASPSPNYQHFNYPFSDLWRTNMDGNIANAAPDLDATITQLFYYTNFMHDYLYALGFDEDAGNFQEDNFEHGGMGSDSVNAEAQDGYNDGCLDDEIPPNPIPCVNNAFFGTPVDGQNPRMQMYMWVPWRPYRDGSLDGDVVAHEYGHGVSSRLITGSNLCCGVQTASMGEGWSDTLSLYVWNDSIVGEYVTGNTTTGIRSVNYATSPLLYSDFNWVTDVCEQHCNGQIWATVLYDLQEALIDKYGSAGGQAQADQLLIDGMKNTINSPTFLDARNGLLAADMTNNGGANQCLIWKVFADREMGLSAASSADQMTVTPATDGPAACLPTAVPGGPYNTDEGIDVDLDGTGSSPGSDPSVSTLTYEWDLDNNGDYEVTGPMPTFDMVGQDGVYTVRLRVTNDAGWSDDAQTTVNVANIAPTVTLDPASPVNENTAITVSGVVSDPGWLESLTATIDWGDGTIEPVTGSLENVRPNATLTFDISHIYGDNGTFTAEVCGFDDDTSTCQAIHLQIDNVTPTAAIDLTDAILINGVPTFLGTAGEPIEFSANSTDPGSDDLTLRWNWGDGSPVEASVDQVNPPLPDPFPSPTIQPRDVTDAAMHTFGEACLYEIQFWSEDDDGGLSAVDSAYVIIVGTADRAQHAGYWQHQYSGNGRIEFDDATLQCYLDIIGFVSNTFHEERDASTIALAHDVLHLQHNGGHELEKLDRQLLTVWLNFANGSMGYLEQFDTNHNGSSDTSLAEIMTTAETVRLDPGSNPRDLRAQRRWLVRLVNLANRQ